MTSAVMLSLIGDDVGNCRPDPKIDCRVWCLSLCLLFIVVSDSNDAVKQLKFFDASFALLWRPPIREEVRAETRASICEAEAAKTQSNKKRIRAELIAV